MKTRKLTAILLALCMLLSLSISAFAADDAVASGTIPDSKIAASGDFETITFAEEPERQPGFLLKATEVEFLSPRKELDDAAELPAAA